MISKEDFKNKDRIIKGISGDKSIKISVVKTTDVVKEAQQRHQLSPLMTVLIGRALTGCMLIAAQQKGEERVQITFQSDGIVNKIYAEANSAGEIRSFTDVPQAMPELSDGEIDLGKSLGNGTLTVSRILYNEAKPITGIVELTDGTITGDLAAYLHQSEQIPSMIALDTQLNDDGSVKHASGLLVQALPDASNNALKSVQESILALPPLGQLLESGHYIDSIMQLAMGDQSVIELDRYPVHFYCRCNKDRFIDSLALLTIDDLADLSNSNQELVCQYCNESYSITKAEIHSILTGAKAKLN